MITQQAKNHAQACYDATREAAIHNHMGDAQKAAYMTILAGYEPKDDRPPSPARVWPPLEGRKDCQCDNCARARSIKPLVGGYQPCSGYVAPPPKIDSTALLFGFLIGVLLISAVAAYPTIREFIIGVFG